MHLTVSMKEAQELVAVNHDVPAEEVTILGEDESIAVTVRQHLRNGNKLHAIKDIKDEYGLGLVEAKNFVEAIRNF